MPSQHSLSSQGGKTSACLGAHITRRNSSHSCLLISRAGLPATNHSRDLRLQTARSGQPNCAPSAMSDLNSPEKPRSEPSLGGSQPHSWSDVTLIEDITQESLSRRLSAHCLGEYIQSSSESEAEQPSPTEPQEQPIPSQIPAQAVCVVKRFRLRSRSRGPALPIAPASDSTQLGIAPGISDKPRLLPLSRVPRPSAGLSAPESPAARRPTPPWSVN